MNAYSENSKRPQKLCQRDQLKYWCLNEVGNGQVAVFGALQKAYWKTTHYNNLFKS